MPDDEQDPQRAGIFSSYGIASAVLGAVAVAAVVLATLIWTQHRGDTAELRYRTQVLQTAADWTNVLINMNTDTVETDLNTLLTGAVTQSVGDSPGRAMGQIVLEVLGPKVIENAVQTYTTPEGFAALIRSGGEIDMKAAASRTIASMNAAAPPVDLSSPAPVTPLEMEPDQNTLYEAQSAAGPTPQAGTPEVDFSIKVKAVRFVGVNAMEVEFASPDHAHKAPVKGIMKLSGTTWKVTRLILPVDEMLDASQMAEMPQ